MTAINIWVASDCAIVCTDAVTAEGKRVLWIGTKMRHFPHLPAVLVYTGRSAHGPLVDEYIGGDCYDFDDLVADLAPAMTDALHDKAAWLQEMNSAGEPFDLYAVGWSRSAQAFQAHVCSYDGKADPQTSLVGLLAIQPGGPEFVSALIEAGVGPQAIMANKDVVGTFKRVMQIQREVAASIGHVIGGFHQLTILTQHKIETAVIDRWPDRCEGG
ncbi:MAG TPA: hypothetical protein VGR32_10135 [Brevundimonas sp.]|jgi:hypothetical protein|uniref:hypothetical protein n=1 Tax=Brevundimonas sp. TaxID=1871086 RepID=UPI002DE5F958|nr:hypothetical protein [Brevundimonas sp.]